MRDSHIPMVLLYIGTGCFIVAGVLLILNQHAFIGSAILLGSLFVFYKKA